MAEEEGFSREKHLEGYEKTVDRTSQQKSRPQTHPEDGKRDEAAPKTKSPVELRADENQGMTYRIGTVLIDRINETSARYNVEKAGLVKFLLTSALDQLDEGTLELKTKPGKRKIEV